MRIPIQLTGATSCTRRVEREEKAPREIALFCSPKDEKEAPRGKANSREKAKAKASREKAKVIAKAKGRKERTLVA